LIDSKESSKQTRELLVKKDAIWLSFLKVELEEKNINAKMTQKIFDPKASKKAKGRL
jgi:hypothetical protein